MHRYEGGIMLSRYLQSFAVQGMVHVFWYRFSYPILSQYPYYMGIWQYFEPLYLCFTVITVTATWLWLVAYAMAPRKWLLALIEITGVEQGSFADRGQLCFDCFSVL